MPSDLPLTGAELSAPREDRLAIVAARQDRALSLPQLKALEFTRREIDGLKDRRHIHPLPWPRVFAVGHPRLNPRGRGLAATLSTGAPLGHQSALAAVGCLPITRQVHVVKHTNGRNRNELWVHESGCLLNRDVFVGAGLYITSPERALLDIAPTVDEAVLFRATNEAQAQEILDETATADLLDRVNGHRGHAPLKAMLQEVAIPVVLRSELERVFFDLVRAAGLPRPDANVPWRDWNLDFVFWEQRVVVEVDGIRFHENERARRRDPAAHNALQLEGFRVLRYTWRRLTGAAPAVQSELVSTLRR